MTMTLDEAVTAIRTERNRQIEKEGYDAAHDDKHSGGELVRAAQVFFSNALHKDLLKFKDGVPTEWPWESEHWKPKNFKHDLIVAGALLVAELERLRRANLTNTDAFADIHTNYLVVLEKLTDISVEGWEAPPSLTVVPNIDPRLQSLEQLRLEFQHWDDKVKNSSGPSSASAAAEFRTTCEIWLKRREREHVRV